MVYMENPWLPWATTGYFIGTPPLKQRKPVDVGLNHQLPNHVLINPYHPPLKHTCATNNAEATDTLGDPGHFIVAEQIA